nr:hypothetical protein [Myxococcota bacterium]
MAADRRRRILRFFGPRGDLLAAESPSVVVYDARGNERVRTEVPDLLDIVAVGEELWAVTPRRIVRLSAIDGRELASEPLDYIDPEGRFLQSTTAPQLPVWHGIQPVVVRTQPARIEQPGPGGELVFPIAEGRWLLWQSGQLKLWRTIGEAWRRSVGEPGSRVIDAQVILDGRLFVLAQRRAGDAADGGELRLNVVAVSDGAQNTQLRIPAVNQLAFAARRGFAVARSGDRLSVIDLRFGRWIRDLVLPDGITDIAVDEGLQRIALANAEGLEIVRPDALATPVHEETAPLVDAAEHASEQVNGESAGLPIAIVTDAPLAAPEPVDPVVVADEALPDAPLVRLDPVSVTSTASAAEIQQDVHLRLQLASSRAALAIAQAWDSGRISKPDPGRPPFASEVAGLLGLASGRAPDDLASAEVMLQATQDLVRSGEQARADRLVPLEVLARDFQLSPIGVAILFAIVAPHLRGELARLYGILANDPGRPLVDEHLLGQLIGWGFTEEIARELDGDRPLRRYGLVRVGGGERPFAALAVDPLVVRYIANQPVEGEPDQFLKVRTVDRDIAELHLPRPLVAKALRFLAAPRDADGPPGSSAGPAPVRIVIRGRTGGG